MQCTSLSLRERPQWFAADRVSDCNNEIYLIVRTCCEFPQVAWSTQNGPSATVLLVKCPKVTYAEGQKRRPREIQPIRVISITRFPELRHKISFLAENMSVMAKMMRSGTEGLKCNLLNSEQVTSISRHWRGTCIPSGRGEKVYGPLIPIGSSQHVANPGFD
jgi:hypothetical protein